jgi:hypothetical protein
VPRAAPASVPPARSAVTIPPQGWGVEVQTRDDLIARSWHAKERQGEAPGAPEVSLDLRAAVRTGAAYQRTIVAPASGALSTRSAPPDCSVKPLSPWTPKPGRLPSGFVVKTVR